MIHSSLGFLNKVLKGSALLMPSTHQLAHSLLNHEVPSSWTAQWEGPEEPSAYLRTLVGKALALGTWQEKCVRDTLLKDGSPLDLSEVFNPATFLNALRQETARYLLLCVCYFSTVLRLLKVSMDSLKFYCTWKKPVIHKLKLPVQV